MTPIPFDPGSVPAKNLLPAGARKYSWMKPYRDYNTVMKRYAEWILSQSDNVSLVIDITNPLTDAIAAKRKIDPKFKSDDGVHPNREGYRLLAGIILQGLGVPAEELKDPEDVTDPQAIHDFVEDLPDLDSRPNWLERFFQFKQKIWWRPWSNC